MQPKVQIGSNGGEYIVNRTCLLPTLAEHIAGQYPKSRQPDLFPLRSVLNFGMQRDNGLVVDVSERK